MRSGAKVCGRSRRIRNIHFADSATQLLYWTKHPRLTSQILNMTNPLVGPSALRDIVNPQFHQNNFPEELYIKNELGIRLDKGNDALHLSTLCTLLTFPSRR
jgi:hypothetical protein